MTASALLCIPLLGTTPPSKRLTIGGLDVLRDTLTPGGFGVELESISVTENGPGGMSSLSFTIDDPKVDVTIAEGQEVFYEDLARGRPAFRGFLQTIRIDPAATGRSIAVTCTGIEAVLDWMVVPPYTAIAGRYLTETIQAMVSLATGIGVPLRAFAGPTLGDITGDPHLRSTPADHLSDLEQPMSSDDFGPVVSEDVVLEGQSLREAIDLVCQAAIGNAGLAWQVSVDFYMGLRLYRTVPTSVPGQWMLEAPADYDPMAVENVPAPTAGRLSTDDIDVQLDLGGVVRGVYIKGANAASSGTVTDGTGLPGPVNYLAEDRSTTADIRDRLGRAYLQQFAMSARITAQFSPIDAAILAADDYRPAGYVRFYPDGESFADETLLSIKSIRKSYPGGTVEYWQVDCGGYAPSYVAQSRRLTRESRA